MKKPLFYSLFIFTLLSYIILLFLYPSLPAKLPFHWNFQGEPNSWKPRMYLLFVGILPSLILVIFQILPKFKVKKPLFPPYSKPYTILTISLTIFAMVSLWVTPLYSLGIHVTIYTFICFPMGLLLLILGNYMPQFPINYIVGFRTPWTIQNKRVWRKTNYIGGILFALGGILLSISSFYGKPTLLLAVLAFILLGCLVICFYSYYLYKNLVLNSKENPHAHH